MQEGFKLEAKSHNHLINPQRLGLKQLNFHCKKTLATSQKKYLWTCVPSKDSDQTVYLHKLIKVLLN